MTEIQTSSGLQVAQATEHPGEEEQGVIRRALALSVVEGIVAAGMFAALEAWVVPLVQVRLGAAAAVIGWLALLPQLITIGLSPATRSIIDWFDGNKRAVVFCAWVQVVCLAGLSIPLWTSGTGAVSHGVSWSVPLAVALVVLLNGVGVISGPAWVAWMGETIPRPIMGRYTSHRNRLFHVSRLSFAALFAGIIQWLPIAGSPWGLQAIIAAAVLSRMASALLLARQGEPVQRPVPPTMSARMNASITSFRQFVRVLPTFPFGKFTLVWSLTNLGIQMAGPFFAAYMLATPELGGMGLGPQPFLFTLLVYTSTVARLASYRVAGRLVDRHGGPAVLRIATFLLVICPLGWVVWPTLPVLIASEVVAGMAWALAECSVGAQLFTCARDPQIRTQLIAWHAMVFNACCVVGVGLGMALLALPTLTAWTGIELHLPALFGSHFHTLFLISIVLRIPAAVLAWRMLPALKQGVGTHDEVELWQLIPGAEITINLGRSVIGTFKRDEDR